MQEFYLKLSRGCIKSVILDTFPFV